MVAWHEMDLTFNKYLPLNNPRTDFLQRAGMGGIRTRTDRDRAWLDLRNNAKGRNIWGH